MPQPFQQHGQPKKRTSILVFLRGATAPLVLYFENPHAIYEELQQILKTSVNKLFEKETIGPLKKVCIQTSEICAIAMQEEQYI